MMLTWKDISEAPEWVDFSETVLLSKTQGFFYYPDDVCVWARGWRKSTVIGKGYKYYFVMECAGGRSAWSAMTGT